MKMSFPVYVMGACVSACALISLPAQAQDARSGTFKTVQGTVTVHQGEARRTAVPGGGMAEAERVQTDPTGSAVLMLRDGTTIAIGPNTTVDLTRFQFESTTQQGSLLVRVLQGSIRLVTGLLGKVQPENVKVTTPATTVSVRGTDFIVEVL
nr:FecR family protein [uncultured Rhodoferax sp.]